MGNLMGNFPGKPSFPIFPVSPPYVVRGESGKEMAGEFPGKNWERERQDFLGSRDMSGTKSMIDGTKDGAIGTRDTASLLRRLAADPRFAAWVAGSRR